MMHGVGQVLGLSAMFFLWFVAIRSFHREHVYMGGVLYFKASMYMVSTACISAAVTIAMVLF